MDETKRTFERLSRRIPFGLIGALIGSLVVALRRPVQHETAETVVLIDIVECVICGWLVGLAVGSIARRLHFRRGWFRFSLRTLFVAVTAICLAGGWVAYQLSWIQERHRLQDNGTVMLGHNGQRYSPTTAPRGLWIFGEPGCYELFYRPEGANQETVEFVYRSVLMAEPPEPLSAVELGRVQAVFPEARLTPFTEAD